MLLELLSQILLLTSTIVLKILLFFWLSRLWSTLSFLTRKGLLQLSLFIKIYPLLFQLNDCPVHCYFFFSFCYVMFYVFSSKLFYCSSTSFIKANKTWADTHYLSLRPLAKLVLWSWDPEIKLIIIVA